MASITCGNCKGTHSSVDHVRECYRSAGMVQAVQAQATGRAALNASDRQIAFLTSLCAERPMWAEANNLHEGTIAKLSRGQASSFIKHALDTPKEQDKVEALPPCPEGYYAISSATGNNDLDFYVVQHGKPGSKWEGRTFVKRVVGGRPDVALRGKDASVAVARILAFGPQEAAALYGREIGQCGRCNRHLTDEESRKAGIGPVCREAAW